MDQKKHMKKEPDSRPMEKIMQFLKTLAGSLVPKRYKRFSEKRLSQGLSYFFHTMTFTLLIIMIILSIQVPKLISDIETEYDNIDRLDIDVNLSLSKDITIAGDKIRITEHGNYSGEQVFVSEEKTILKPMLCIFFRPACMLQQKSYEKRTEQYGDLIKQKNNVMKIISALIFLSLPTLILLYLLFIGIKTFMICFVTAIVLAILKHALKRKGEFLELFLISLYAGSVILITEPINLLFHPLNYLNYLAFTVLSITGFFIVTKSRRHF